MVDILQQPDAYHQPVGRVAEVLGNYADPGMEIEIALRKHALPHRFPDDALAQAKATPKKVRKKDWTKDRVDLRDLPLVTIDGETARDFDDAVYAEKLGKGYRLVVAIATSASTCSRATRWTRKRWTAAPRFISRAG